MVRMRGIWFRSPEYMDSFYTRTLMIQDVPKKFQSDEGIRAIFQSMQMPYPTTSVHIGRRVGDLPQLIKKHNNTVRELEHVLVAYLKDGKLGKKRPTVTPGGGFGGKKVDAIDYYTCVSIPGLVVCPPLTTRFHHRLERSSKQPRKRSKIIVVRSTTVNQRTTASLLWLLFPTPILLPTCSRTRNQRVLRSSWPQIPKTSYVDHNFFVAPHPVNFFQDMEQSELER